jgi:hypothetical protein
VVDSYIYVGALIHNTLDDQHEIKRRILLANKHVGCLRKKVLGNRTTHYSTKKTVYESMVLGILLYGAETWIITKATERLVQGFHRRIVRTMANVNMMNVRKHHITSAELEERLQVRTARDYLDARLLGYAGHIARMPTRRWPKLLLSPTCPHPRPVGAPPTTYVRQLHAIFKRKRLPDPDAWMRFAQNRQRWRTFIKTSSPAPARTSPAQPLPGQRLHQQGHTGFSGTILGCHSDDYLPTWTILKDDGSTADLDRATITRITVPDSDKLEWVLEILRHPASIIGRPVEKTFHPTRDRSLSIFTGIVTDTDTDHSNNQLWGVTFHDGDKADYFAHEIVDMLTSYLRPPPLLGRHVSKIFNNSTHNGVIYGIDKELHTGHTLWMVEYEDGDKEDYYLNEIVRALHLHSFMHE